MTLALIVVVCIGIALFMEGVPERQRLARVKRRWTGIV